MNERLKWSIIIVSTAFFGVISGYVFQNLRTEKNEVDKLVSDSKYEPKNFLYLNPILSLKPELYETVPFKKEIQALINQKIKAGLANNISVKYVELDNGYAFTINSEEKYYPASLLKVHTMLWMLRKEKYIPGYLNTPVFFDPAVLDADMNQYGLKPGSTYTIKQLMEQMIRFSDNMATKLLHSHVPADSLTIFYKELGLSTPGSELKNLHKLDDFITISDYSRIFKQLYNSSFLPRELSEYGIELLTRIDFPHGFLAGFPKGTIVAHKFGVWKNPGITQLHEVGIVYAPDKTYLLAVMTKGSKDEHALASVIKDIAAMVAKYSAHRINL